MAHAIADTLGRRKQIEDEIRVAGVDRELVARFEVRGRARVVADNGLARRDFDSANVRQPRHRLDVARMQVRRLARRCDVGIVVEEQWQHPAGTLEDGADVALDEFGRLFDVLDRQRCNNHRVRTGVDCVIEVVECIGARVSGDAGPCFDFLRG